MNIMVFKYLKIKIICIDFIFYVYFLKKLFLNSSFHGGLFFIFYFDIIMKYFLSSHFSFYFHDKHSVIISKAHYKFTFLLKFIHILK
jgi:hypothetical protein